MGFPPRSGLPSPHLPPNSRVVAMGDSETSNFTGGPSRIGLALAGRGVWGGVYATAGFTIEQVRDVELPLVLALKGWQKPAAAMILAGTNSVGANSGGGVGTGFNFASSKAAYLTIIRSLLGAQIVPVICTIPPRTDATLANTNVRQWNVWLFGIAAELGLPLVDYWSTVLNVANGGWASGMTADGIHFNGEANVVAAAAAKPILQAIIPQGPPPYLTRHVGDLQNLMASFGQLFLGAPSGGVAGNWSASGTGCIFTVVTGDATIAGNWQTLNRPLAGSANAFLHTAVLTTTGFSVGDRLAVACLYKTSGFTTNVNQSGFVYLNCRDVSNAVLATANPIASIAGDVTTNALAYDEIVVPAGTTNLDFGAGVNGAATDSGGATLQIAQFTIINLTALGLA